MRPSSSPISTLQLSKHHGLGNDFLVALDERAGTALAIDGDLARHVCDRRRGIGADGLIHGAAPTPDQAAAGFDVVMHLFNSDGSRAEMSGNGIRCLAQAVARQRGITEGQINALTDAGPRTLRVSPARIDGVVRVDDGVVPVDDGVVPVDDGVVPVDDGVVPVDDRTVLVSVGMGRPSAGPHVPGPVEEFLDSRHATVDMGNPHLVILVPDPASVDLLTEGSWLEQQFPLGINVEYISVDGPDHLRLRVWERGAGITEACGTGACAAVHAAHGWGIVDARVAVAMPGGDATVVLEADGSVSLIGPSVHIADIEVSRPDHSVTAASDPGDGTRERETGSTPLPVEA